MLAQAFVSDFNSDGSPSAELRGTSDKIYVHALSLGHKLAVGTLTLSGTSVAFVAMYMIKSAVGIDLFPGPSFMHDTFYIY